MHRTRLEAFVCSQVSDRHMAEDVVADVFVAAWRRRVELPRETARAVGWLYATARNVIRNHVRGEMRRRKLVEKATRHTATSPCTATDFVPGVDRLAAAAAWNELPATERQLLVLVGTGASHSEIAEVLGISLGGVAMRVMRARVRLRRGLED